MIAAVTTNQEPDDKLRAWLADLSVDYERVYEIQQALFNMYGLLKDFDIKKMRPLLEKLPKPSP